MRPGPIEAFNINLLQAKGSLFATRPTLNTYAAKREDLLVDRQRPVQRRRQRQGENPGQPEIRAQGCAEGAPRPRRTRHDGLVDPDPVAWPDSAADIDGGPHASSIRATFFAGRTDMSDMSTAKPAPWGVVATFGWLVLSLVIGQAAAVAGLLVWFGEDSLARVSVSLFDGPLLAVTTVISNAAQIGVLAFAVRRRGWRVSDYFALGAFTRREFALGALACAAVAGMIALFGWLANLELVTPFQIQAYMTTPKNLWLAAVFFAVVIAGPLGEEIVFRGFLFRGLGPPGRASGDRHRGHQPAVGDPARAVRLVRHPAGLCSWPPVRPDPMA